MLLLFICLFLVNQALAQSHYLQLQQVRGGGDSLFVDVFIRTDSLNFHLGSSNFVFQVSNPSAFVELDPALPNGPEILERGVWDQSGSNPSSSKSYHPMQLAKILFPAATLNLSVLSKTSCAFPPAPPCGIVVPNTFTKIARILFRVADCSQSNQMIWLTNRGAFNDFPGNPIPRLAFNYQSAPLTSLCPINFVDFTTNDADTTICPYQLFSFQTNAQNVDSYKLTIDGNYVSTNLTGFWAIDTFTTSHILQISMANSCGCLEDAYINLNVIPVDTTITLPTPYSTCTNQDAVIPLNNTQNGANYYLTSDSQGSNVISNTQTGNGGTINLTIPSTNLVIGSNTVFLWTNFNGCLLKIDSLTFTNQVPIQPTITGNSTVLISTTGVYTVPTSGITNYTWSIISSVGSSILSVLGNSVTIQFGNAAGQDSLFVLTTDINGCTARDTFLITVSGCTALATGERNDTLVCLGTQFPVFFTTFVGNSIQWQDSISGGNWQNSTNLGFNGQVMLAGPITQTTFYRAIAYGLLCNDTTNVIQVDVLSPPVAGVASVNSDTVCQNDNVILSVTGHNGSVQWQQSADNITWTDIAGATTTPYNHTLTATTYFRARIVTCDTSYTNAEEVTMVTPASGSFSTSVPPICAGGLTIPLSATVSGVGASGTWSSNGAGYFTNPNDPNAQYISTVADAGQNITLTWTVSTPFCTGSQSYSQIVTVGGGPQANVAPIQPAICIGQNSAPLGAAAINGTGHWELGTPANGSFSNINDPNAIYIPAPADANTTVELLWIVQSPGCLDDTAKTYLYVGDAPAGSFNTPIPTICAGDTTIPLNATVSVGTGTWTSNGAGYFIPNAFAPNAQYVSDPSDAGKKISILWIVQSGTCTPVTYQQLVQVDEPPAGNFNTVLPAICAGGSTIPLNASVTVGSGVWSTNGQGTFSAFGDPNAVYYAALADAGQTITLTWTIGNGVCDSIAFSMPITILNDSIIGSFNTNVPAICAGDATIPLGASVTAPATGTWSSPNGLGFFSNPNDPNATYQSSPFDQGLVTLRWTVSKPGCNNLVIDKNVFVFPKPIGIFNSAHGPLCINDTTGLLVGFTSIGASYFSHNGTGNLLPQFNLGNSQGVLYEPGAGDVGDTVAIYWITQNGVCTPDTQTVLIPVSPLPQGSFNTVIPDICAGALTIPLGATATVGTGEWSTPNGTGSFGDKFDPNTFYNSNLADSGQKVYLVWTVKTSGCDSISFVDSVNVLNTKVEGSFDFQPAPVCAGDATAPLGATTQFGTGTWSTTGQGFFVPNNTDPNAQYFSLASEAGDTIDLIWTISNPPCNDLPLKQKLIILTPPDGDFPVAPDTICFGGITAPLGATVNVGTGSWQVLQGTGGFSDPTNPNAVYISGPGDAGATIKLSWNVSNGACPIDANIQEFYVSPPPAGDNQTPVQPYCAGALVPLKGITVLGTGYWATPNGSGTFLPNIYNPQAQYQSTLTDAGQSITFYWIVSTPRCTPDTNTIIIPFLNSIVNGSFTLNQDTVCAEETTIPLNGIVIQGNASWSSPNGAGFFIPNINDPNAVYQTDLADAGKYIKICWNLTNSGCDTTKYCDSVFVVGKPSGGFPNAPANICISDTSDTLFAYVTSGKGFWTTDGSGFFIDPDTTETVYVPGPSDGNTLVTLTWNVLNDYCDTVKYSRQMYVYAEPQGSFNTPLSPICAGELTPPLNATVTIGTGLWTTNGNGGFTNSTNPNASYISTAADAGSNIQINWVVFNGVCDTVVYSQNLQIDAPSLGAFNTILGAICENDTSIPLGATVINGVGFWTSQGPGSFINPSDPNTQFIAGDVGSDTTFFLEWNVVNGVCNTVTYTRSIRVYNSPSGTFDVPVDTTCPLVPTNILQATVTYGNAIWTSNGGGAFTNPTSGNAQYVPSLSDAGQTITLTWNIYNGTCDTLKLTQDVYVVPLPNTYAGNDTTVCPGDTIQLQASGANFYTWFPPIGLSDPTIPNPQAVLSNTTTFIVTGYLTQACYTTDTVVITVNPQGSVQAPPDVQICRGDSVQLSATGTNIIAWQWSPTDGLSDPTLPNPIAKPQNTTVYTVTATTATGCNISDQVIVNVIPFTSPVIFGSDACQGQDQIYLYAIKDATSGNTFWFNGTFQDVVNAGPLNSSNPRYISNIDSILINTNSLGTYTYTLYCQNPNTGCDGYDEFSINVVPFPVASFTSDKQLCAYDDRTVQFTSTSQNATFYYWQFGDPASGNLNTDTIPNPVHTFSGPGKYSIALFVMNELGCADLVILDDYIEVYPPEYYFPSAFSPNGDGLNDIFRALPPGSANVLSMKIWDRWGKLVFESTNDNTGWTGYTADGKPFDPGTYTYKVLIQLPNQPEPKVYTGYVTLIR